MEHGSLCQLQLLMLKTSRLVQQNDIYLQDTLALTSYSGSSVANLMFWCPLGSTSSFWFIKGTFPRIRSSFCELHNIVGGINISDVLLQTCGDSDMMNFVVLALFVAGGKDLWYTTQLQHFVYQPNTVLQLCAPFRIFKKKEFVSVCPLSLWVRPASRHPSGDQQGGWRSGCQRSQLALAGKTCWVRSFTLKMWYQLSEKHFFRRQTSRELNRL